MTARQSSSDMRASSPSRVMPALLIRMSMSPVSAISFSTSSAFVTSAYSACPPTSRATSSFSLVPGRSQQRTSAPAPLSRAAIARPMPRAAPVISARFPSSEAYASGNRQHLLDLLERGQAVDRDRLDAAVDALDQARKHVAGANLDEGAHAV